MNADSQLTELRYDRTSILLRAIHSIYNVYTQRYLVGPILADLRECTRRLVTSLLWVKIIENNAIDEEVVVSIYRIIEGSCAGRGEGWSTKFAEEFCQWAADVVTIHTKQQYEANNASGDQEGREQV